MKTLLPIPEERLYDLLLGRVSEPEFESLSEELQYDSRISVVAQKIQEQPDPFLSELRGAIPLDRPEYETKAQRVFQSLSLRKAPDAALTQVIDQTLKSEGFLEKVAIPQELDHFRIVKKLGEGGMGTVYEAQDTRLNRTVALKVLRPELLSKPDAKQRLLREARAVAGLSHDNILTIHHVAETDGNIYFVMPILEGETLADRLKSKQTLPMNECLKFGTQIAQGLKYAHDQGVVHRDIKPANIWVESKSGDRIKILDFGLARKNSGDATITINGSILGTPAYMAPEQARGEQVDPRADLFSLGVVLYELSTGKRPFDGEDTLAVLTSIAVDEPTAPHRVNPTIPKSFSDLVMKLLEKKTKHRFQNADEVLSSLEKITAEPVRPVSTTRSNIFSKSFTSVALALLLSFAVVGLGFAVYKFTFATKDGTLVVEADENADFRFRKGKLEIYDEAGKLVYTLEGSEKNKTLPEGKYLLKVVDAKGVAVESPELLVKKGEETKVRVQIIGDGLTPSKGIDTPDRKWAEWAITKGGGGVEIRRGKREITKVEDLPNDAFEVTGIRIEKSVTADSMVKLGKVPNLLSFETKDIDDNLIKAIADCKTLKTLRGKSAIGMTAKGYELLKGFNQLEVVDLALVSNKNEDYEFLKSLPQLKVLNLSDSVGFKDDWSENLKNIKALEEFRIARIPIEAGSLQKIGEMKSLRVVVFNNVSFGGGEFARVSGLTNLEQLNLSNSLIGDAEMVQLQKLTKLRGLDLQGTKITDASIKNLEDLKDLEVLNLNGTSTDDVIPILKEFKKLRSVNFTNFTKDGAEDLAKTLPDCEIGYGTEKIIPKPKKKLDLKPIQTQDRKWAEWVIRFGGGGVEIKGGTKEITKLDDLPKEDFELTGIRIDYSIQSSSLSKLGKCPNLEKFQTRYADDEMIKALEDCKNLKYFKAMSALTVTTKGYDLMKKFEKLEVLDLYLIQAKDTDFQFLSDLKQLKILNMAGANDLKGKWMEYLKENKSLEQLRIITSPLGEGNLKNIADKKSLKTLVLSNMQFVRGELANIAELTDLEYLNLSGTKIVDEEMVHLKKLTKLKGLDLQQTQITDEALKSIAGCLQLEVLNLNGVITNDAIPILKEFKKLRSISFTNFTKEGAEELARTLPGCEISYDKGKIFPPFKKIRP